MIVAFTGHRPQKLGGYGPSTMQTMVRVAVRTLLVEKGATAAISGMALGVDQWAAEVCVELGIPFTAAVPFVGQESQWPEESQRHYQLLLQRAYNVVVVSPGPYHPWKLQRRNEWMVDNCDVLLAFWDGSPGGTANCVRYAEEVRRTRWLVDPRQLRLARPEEIQ